jgi:dTDP-4-dehydrorhamnose reductase
MLGCAMLRVLSGDRNLDVYGTMRQENARRFFAGFATDHLLSNIDVTNEASLLKVFTDVQPSVVINCVGLVKQLAEANDPLQTIPINSLLPHRLAALCADVGARLIHISTDCVFSGVKGDYSEADAPDANDLYGRSKLLGEVEGRGAITLRTSIIGHELAGGRHGLLEWFLHQEKNVKGYRRAIFSGLPTVELAAIIRDYVLPRSDLSGLYHVASAPISKDRNHAGRQSGD